jgi:hypothetical protein
MLLLNSLGYGLEKEVHMAYIRISSGKQALAMLCARTPRHVAATVGGQPSSADVNIGDQSLTKCRPADSPSGLHASKRTMGTTMGTQCYIMKGLVLGTKPTSPSVVVKQNRPVCAEVFVHTTLVLLVFRSFALDLSRVFFLISNAVQSHCPALLL